jgi:hypothetical protein
MNTCPAVKNNGEVCGKRCTVNPRCAIHMKTLEQHGPHTTALNELKSRHKAAMRRLHATAEEEQENITDVNERNRHAEDTRHQANVLRIEQTREVRLLVRQFEDEIRETGIDPDAVARQRREALINQRREANRVRFEERFAQARLAEERLMDQREANQLIDRFRNAAVENLARAQQQQGELARFANDNQNVHTTAAVQQTKDIVNRILKIPVPEEYRWNMTECSKTPGEIILTCKLTPKGAWQMQAKYCQDEDIYEMGRGIYGKVLDGVWQYIVKSPDKNDLYAILKQEMEDNIGMCAQGNLTRLCNILAGYMEGVGAQESPAEVLGRKLPLLMEIENEEERLKQAFDLLTEMSIPQEQWLSWVEPLVDRTVSLRSNGAGQVIGFAITA